MLRLSDERLERAALAAHLHADDACWRVIADVLHLPGPRTARVLADAFRRLCDQMRRAEHDPPQSCH